MVLNTALWSRMKLHCMLLGVDMNGKTRIGALVAAIVTLTAWLSDASTAATNIKSMLPPSGSTTIEDPQYLSVTSSPMPQPSSSATIEDPPDYPRFTQASASSQLSDQQFGDKHYTYNPEHVLDKNTDTAWNEGVDGPGLQQWIRVSASTPQHVQGLSIKNGYPLNDNIYWANNRAKDITIELSDGSTMTTALDDAYNTLQNIFFESPHDIVWIRITINSIYKGSEYDDTCISYIEAF